MTRRSWILAAALLAASTAGCEQGEFSPGLRASQAPLVQGTAARARVTPEALESLYRLRWRGGVPLQADPVRDATPDAARSWGPLDARLFPSRWQVLRERDGLSLVAEFDRLEVVVPLRLIEGVSTRICRVRVHAEAAELRVALSGGAAEPAPLQEPSAGLVAASTGAWSWTSPTAALIGDCPALERAPEAQQAAFDQAMDYLQGALEEMGRAMASLDPGHELGLLDEPFELSHVTPFDNRRGRMAVFSQAIPSSSRVGTSGWSTSLNTEVDSLRAGCVPPVEVELPEPRSPAPIALATLNAAGADVGYALSARTLAALIQHSVRAGFACEGLEAGARVEDSSDAFASADLALDRIGLGSLPIGDRTLAALSPGAIPSVQLRPDTGVIALTWSDLGIDLYTTFRGVPVRVLQVTTSFDVTLQPAQPRQGSLDFQVSSIEVRSTRLESTWAPPDWVLEDDARPWTRRLLLILLEDRVSLPSPLEPGSPLEIVASQIREVDVLFLLEIVAAPS